MEVSVRWPDGARELYRTARDPSGELHKITQAAGKIAEDPYGTALRAASAVGEGLIEPPDGGLSAVA